MTSESFSSSSDVAPSPPPLPPIDKSSLSNPQQIVVTHLDWEVNVDFDSSTLTAVATYDLRRFDPKATILSLDTSNLIIIGIKVHEHNLLDDTIKGSNVSRKYGGSNSTGTGIDSSSGNQNNTTTSTSTNNDNNNNITQNFTLSNDGQHPNLGKQLNIDVGLKSTKVSIYYKTTTDSTALQWLPPSQTADKKYPYLFTQCQAIHARSLLPCQDAPGIKITYKATITVPSWSTCVMSALYKTDKINPNNSNEKIFVWDQPTPLSSYLIAMAVGQIESIDISDRVRIWSEPSIVKSAAYEFEDTEKFIQIAEKISGLKYQWHRYDLLCLPPSFPYGGMENPCLTFVTPTLLAGDKSLADVVAHEIAHSWTGNLVTNATWEHFWLNEGWTTWFQRKIMSDIYNNTKFLDFDAISGYKSLKESIDLMPKEYTKLHVNLSNGQDPDDAFSKVPYEKGFNLLYALECLVGHDKFENFFKAYINEYANKTITSDEFSMFFTKHFPNVGKEFKWNEWFNMSGLPKDFEPKFDQTLAMESTNLALDWLKYDKNITSMDTVDTSETTLAVVPKTDITNWSSNQIVCFLDKLEIETTDNSQPLHIKTIEGINKKYNFSSSNNSEILYRYCMLAIDSNDKSIIPTVTKFITTQGRMKFVRPLYRALYKQNKFDKQIAINTFLQNKDFYHPICSKMIAVDLSQNTKEDGEKKKGGILSCIIGSTSSSDNNSMVLWLGIAAILGTTAGIVLLRSSNKRR